MRIMLHSSKAVMLATRTLDGRFLLTLGLACLTLVPAQADENEEDNAWPPKLFQWITAEGRTLQPKNKADAAEIIKLRWGRRSSKLFSGPCSGPLNLIGTLSTSSHWTKILPLGKAQATAITKLDELVQEARTLSSYADADYPADDLASYEAYLARSHERRQATIRHAQRMVDLGLLTQPQAAFVLQRFMTTRRRSHVMYNEHVQELLGMTASQKEEMVHIAENYRDELVSPALWKILTPNQRETWSRLTADRTLPAEPPNLPSSLLIDAETTGIKLAELSPTFRVLLANLAPTFRVLVDTPKYHIGLSPYQKRLLNDLVEVTRDGLLWISLRNSNSEEPIPRADARNEQTDPIAQTRAEFLKHAEQVALLGILTEQQAERVQAALKEK